ncbi:MAG: DUF1343 domain-containing protein [Acidobacteriota bacterium]|nr:DUF1343 domain-containing protein [Acidobacteriota bacterium]MDE3264525.1 DUF1343 domain-containing protein [Acidobacteriota bacterium]
MPIRSGLDRLLDDAGRIRGRRYALLCHQASLSLRGVHAHVALDAVQPAATLLGPEHGFYGVEQDMVASGDERDPWTGSPVVSLYGGDAGSLRPQPGILDGCDLVVIDLQDVGARYYTFAATAVWAAEAALLAGCEVWVLDRPNPLGGLEVEGNLLDPDFTSFVGAFRMPQRHGLTMAEILLLEGRRRGWDRGALTVFEVEGWRRRQTWREVGWHWTAPSPNMPTPETAHLYPGLCLLEATTVSEGRGTTRPFQLLGVPGADAPALAGRCSERLAAAGLGGVSVVPAMFRPQFQKHAGSVCSGVELRLEDAGLLRPVRLGFELLLAFRDVLGEDFGWRSEPYEFVADTPAIDLLAGTDRFRTALDAGDAIERWYATWEDDQREFRAECGPVLLYS